MALEQLQALTIPYLVMPGNHDDRAAIRRVFAAHPYLPRDHDHRDRLQRAPDAPPRSFLGPPACMLRLWQPGHGLVSPRAISAPIQARTRSSDVRPGWKTGV
jgi:hypothetical protein